MKTYVVTERTLVEADDEESAIEVVVNCIDGEVLEQSATELISDISGAIIPVDLAIAIRSWVIARGGLADDGADDDLWGDSDAEAVELLSQVDGFIR